MPFTAQTTYPFVGTAWYEVPAVYGIMNAQRQWIYIGQTDDLKRRMAEHAADRTHLMHRYAPALVVADVVRGGDVARRQLETALIAEYAPPANRA